MGHRPEESEEESSESEPGQQNQDEVRREGPQELDPRPEELRDPGSVHSAIEGVLGLEEQRDQAMGPETSDGSVFDEAAKDQEPATGKRHPGRTKKSDKHIMKVKGRFTHNVVERRLDDWMNQEALNHTTRMETLFSQMKLMNRIHLYFDDEEFKLYLKDKSQFERLLKVIQFVSHKYEKMHADLHSAERALAENLRDIRRKARTSFQDFVLGPNEANEGSGAATLGDPANCVQNYQEEKLKFLEGEIELSEDDPSGGLLSFGKDYSRQEAAGRGFGDDEYGGSQVRRQKRYSMARSRSELELRMRKFERIDSKNSGQGNFLKFGNI